MRQDGDSAKLLDVIYKLITRYTKLMTPFYCENGPPETFKSEHAYCLFFIWHDGDELIWAVNNATFGNIVNSICSVEKFNLTQNQIELIMSKVLLDSKIIFEEFITDNKIQVTPELLKANFQVTNVEDAPVLVKSNIKIFKY
jgi:hypothetical protein